VATAYIHTCYRILDPEKSADFYVNKLGMKKVGEMHFSDATNYFFAMEEDAPAPMLKLTHNHEIGRASCRKECPVVCRSRWSPYH
jgi:lactoylglutathione lyase